MKKYVYVWLMIMLLLPFHPHNLKAESWVKVVERGFNNPWNDYAWSMATFRERLFVGTMSIQGGAEIWYSSSGEKGTWNKVYKSYIKDNTGIRALYVDGDEAIYAGTLNVTGAQILRSTDGINWTRADMKGIPNPMNTSIRSITRFKGYLYAGGGGNRACLWRSRDGQVWEKVKCNPSIASTIVTSPTHMPTINNILIGELAVFNDQLYAFTWTKDLDHRSLISLVFVPVNESDPNGIEEETKEETASVIPTAVGAFEVWRSPDGSNWEKVVGLDDHYGNGMGFSEIDKENMYNDVITSVAVFEGKLYLGTEHDAGKTSVWRTSNGTKWEKVLDFFELGEKFNYYVWRMIPFDDKLFVGTLNLGPSFLPKVTGAQIWVSETGDPHTFYNIVDNGFDGEFAVIFGAYPVPKNYGVRSFGILNNTLYAGTATVVAMPAASGPGDDPGRNVGCEIWKMMP